MSAPKSQEERWPLMIYLPPDDSDRVSGIQWNEHWKPIEVCPVAERDAAREMLHAVRQAIANIEPSTHPMDIRSHLSHLTSEKLSPDGTDNAAAIQAAVDKAAADPEWLAGRERLEKGVTLRDGYVVDEPPDGTEGPLPDEPWDQSRGVEG